MPKQILKKKLNSVKDIFFFSIKMLLGVTIIYTSLAFLAMEIAQFTNLPLFQ